MKALWNSSFAKTLKCLMENESLIFASQSMQGEINRIKKLGNSMKRKLELQSLALNCDLFLVIKGGTSFSNLCKIYLELDLIKTHQISD